MAGYFENDALTQGAYDADGNYLAGDLAAIDDDGNVRMVFRAGALVRG